MSLTPSAFRGSRFGTGGNRPIGADFNGFRDAPGRNQYTSPAGRDALHLGPLGDGEELKHFCRGSACAVRGPIRHAASLAPPQRRAALSVPERNPQQHLPRNGAVSLSRSCERTSRLRGCPHVEEVPKQRGALVDGDLVLVRSNALPRCRATGHVNQVKCVAEGFGLGLCRVGHFVSPVVLRC